MDMAKGSALLMGYAQADIRPPWPVVTIGFGRGDELSRGASKPPSAQVTVWQLGEERCCLAANSPLQGERRDQPLHICRRIALA